MNVALESIQIILMKVKGQTVPVTVTSDPYFDTQSVLSTTAAAGKSDLRPAEFSSRGLS